ncbi:MAG: winged helix-turn-helix domain-containing protein [Caulobacteraceae bacterium]|nr:winged helix-turn-helix domain-containing protein [Caulobacteraceae bacterium]
MGAALRKADIDPWERIAELEAENAWLKGDRDGDDVARLHDAYDLTATEGKVVLTLYRARGRTVSVDFIVERALDPDREYLGNATIVNTHISHCREKMPPGMIDTVWHVGRRLSPKGLRVLDALFGK